MAHECGAQVFDAEMHRVIEKNYWLNSAKIRAQQDGYANPERLFLMHDLRTGSVIFAAWVRTPEEDRACPLYIELYSAIAMPGVEKVKGIRVPDWPTMDNVSQRLRPAWEHAADARRKILEGEERETKKKLDEIENRARCSRDLDAAGAHDLASAVRLGFSPPPIRE